MRALGWLAIAACAPAPVTPRETGPLEVTLERTACRTRCPIYRVTIHADGAVDWLGTDFVTARGEQRGQLDPAQQAELAAAIDRADLAGYERDASFCSKAGVCRVGSRCTDTSHALLEVKRGAIVHRLDDWRCHGHSPLDSLEQTIDRLAGTQRWTEGRSPLTPLQLRNSMESLGR